MIPASRQPLHKHCSTLYGRQGSRVERATRQHAFGDAIVARRELRNAINGGRPEEVVAAAAAAQKIIDSFKRSQARRRSKALVPQQRQTLNRRVGAHARPSSGAPTSARAVVAGASRRGPSAAELKNHFEQPPFRAGAAPPEREATQCISRAVLGTMHTCSAGEDDVGRAYVGQAGIYAEVCGY